MTTFALVHGAWHGAWCWDPLTPLLERAGHTVVAMDLPADDPSAGFPDYADVVCSALDGCDDDVVLVGHSMGGHTVPLVAARRPVRLLVYLCALIPDVGRSLADQVAEESGMANPLLFTGLHTDECGRTTWADLDLARTLFFADCDEATVAGALSRLRAQSTHPNLAPYSLAEFPSIPCTSVVCNEDQMLGLEWARRIARDRLGADIIELPGSHSPMLSRPSALADVLLGLGN